MKVYVITGTSGSYSDRQDWNVCAYPDKHRAQECAGKLNQLIKFKNAFIERLQNEFDKPYRAAHNVSTYGWHRYEMSPEFAAVNKIQPHNRTDEEKALHRKLQVEHIENKRAFEEEQKRLVWAMEEARKTWVKENYIVPPELEEVVKWCEDQNYYSDASYHYDKLEML